MSFWNFLGSAVGGLLGLNAAESTNESNIEATRLYNESQERLAKEAQEYNERMWQKQADWNSPLQMMQRIREAGLNPNLVYGQVGSGNMSSSPQAVMPNIKPEHRENYYSNILQNMAQQLSANIMQTQQLEAIKLKNDEQKIKNDWLRRTLEDRVNYEGYKTGKTAEDASSAGHRARILQNQADIATWERNLQKELHQSGMALNDAIVKSKTLAKQLDILGRQYDKLGFQNTIYELDAIIFDQTGIRPGDPWYMRIILDFINRYVMNSTGEGIGDLFDEWNWQVPKGHRKYAPGNY